ncbi:MAG TPA: 16S rRNA (adenine(1518)-N(6)/adenine(1519)-N(6))-dimethyltransferase RsmA [Chthoniobacteraceae bacterium]|nr:16S rRNA (adenine(1518)-N(6)/adenine(1519)-N(6))-dimethyltransferase RsmA [Chthoniobacteraceae bacterium]
MKLSRIQSTLSALGTAPVRSLGQNFLHDQNVAQWIVAQLELHAGEPWVELGPGLGALTRFAAAVSTNGLLIEKDGRLAAYLREHFPKLEIIHGDAAKFDVRELFARGPVKVLGNLPYYISSQILLQFTAEPSPVARLVFTLQRELAERLAAAPRTKEYGALTILVGRRWRVKMLRTLPPTVFMPAPQVESGVVLLTPRTSDEYPACDGQQFVALVKKGFSQRRKQLRKMLAGDVKDWAALCAALDVPATVRAEELSIAQWINLTNFVAPRGKALGAQDVHGEIFDVVDADDTVVGQASRDHVHTRDLRHRAVHIFVFNKRGDLFLQKRSRWKDRHPEKWDSSAAGHVEAGQTFAATAHRELQEELGVDVEELEPLGRIAACVETGWEFVQLYRTVAEGPFALPPAEIETGGFFTKAQIARWIEERREDFAPGFLACWERMEVRIEK